MQHSKQEKTNLMDRIEDEQLSNVYQDNGSSVVEDSARSKMISKLLSSERQMPAEEEYSGKDSAKVSLSRIFSETREALNEDEENLKENG